MNPGLVVKLRPTGPWRIGPDSGARNQVDVIYHSDSLYSAVTSALSRLGLLEEWLEATARNGVAAVSFSSCFPFIEEIGFVVPPRTVWPPTATALLAARVRWKTARFVPLGIVQALLAGQTLDDQQWAVDGPSSCLVPEGRSGPFRTGLRFNVAVDRLTGATERHSTACLEFRPGAGLWTIVSFADEPARDRWLDPLKTAFRLLADGGFGGERSRGWGRSEMPEFVEGTLPEMILGAGGQGPGAGEVPTQPEPIAVPEEQPTAVQIPASESAEAFAEPEAPAPSPWLQAPDSEALAPAAQSEAPAPGPRPPTPVSPSPFWLLSLFTPSASDQVDWQRGSYSVLARGGRIESPVRAGELKKQLSMIAEGSVLYAADALRGSAPDVAPDGFAHPVFRSGFALSIPLPEVS